MDNDPRDYIRGGGRRCALRKSDWLDDWYVSHSPRNCNQNAEGSWEDWVELAQNILAADKKVLELAEAQELAEAKKAAVITSLDEYVTACWQSNPSFSRGELLVYIQDLTANLIPEKFIHRAMTNHDLGVVEQ